MTATTASDAVTLDATPRDPLPPESSPGDKPAKAKLPRAVVFALLAIIGADVMDLLDATIMNIAGPVLSTDLRASSAALQWIVAGYTLAFAVMLTTGGRLGDVFGRKRMFLVGISGFLAGSVLCSLAQNSGELIGFRILQGLFAAVMIPQGLGILKQIVPKEQMTAVFGIFGPMMGLAATFGPILGGWLVNADLFGLGWRAIFLINAPVAVIALTAATRVLPADVAHPEGRAPKLDILGMLLATGAIMLLVYPLVQGREAGWPAWTFLMTAASVPAFAVFGIHQRLRFKADKDPFVVPTLFRKRSFTSGIAVMLCFNVAMSGIFFTSTLFLQMGLGYTALHAGLTMVPWSIGTIISMGAGQGLIPKIGPRRTLQLGMLTMAVGATVAAVLIGRYALTTTSWTLTAPIFILGLGMGLIFGPIFGTVLGDLDENEVGSASGLLNAVQQLAGAFGIAALGTLYFDKALPSGAMPDFSGAANLVFLVSAGLLVVAWAMAFSMSKHMAEDDMH